MERPLGSYGGGAWSTTLPVLATLLSGLPAFAQAATEERSLDKRTYRFHMGRAAKKPAPLIICIHGLGSNGQQTETLTGLSELADTKGFAVAYPDGERKMWRYQEGSEDVEYIKALMDALVKSGEADPKRIYATGISNGAYMSNRLAIDLGDRIAAIAPVAGSLLKPMAAIARPPRPMPVMAFHGTADEVVGYDGKDAISKRALSLPAEEMAAWWAQKNGCADKPEVEKIEDKADDQTNVERWSWKAGEKGAPVVFFKIEGGGHTWPGSKVNVEKLLGKCTREILASELLWEFFEKFSLKN
jgi:polyhydroxybutyrate depolymerase